MRAANLWLSSLAACSVFAACSSQAPAEVAETQGKLQLGPEAMVYDQGWRVDQHVRLVADVDNDGDGDLLGFGNEGVFLADPQSSGDGSMDEPVVPDMGNNEGWTLSDTVRTLADVNGDGLLDVVGIGTTDVRAALKSAGPGYDAATRWSTEFTSLEGWTAADTRLLGDVTGDGMADIVGINNWGVYVAEAKVDADQTRFDWMEMWLRGFGKPDTSTEDWDTSKHIRMLADVDGDGLADIVGFGETGVWVSRSNGERFLAPEKQSEAFGYNSLWRIGTHVRAVANLNNDRFADLIGLGPVDATGTLNVQVALGNAGGFAAPQIWDSAIGSTTGWLVRLIGDVDGDGRDDVVGIKNDHVYLAHNNGAGFDSLAVVSDEFTAAKGWDVAKHPRFLSDVDGDGQLDLVGFFNDAVYWDRLTPPVSIPPDWTTPTCAASRLGPPAPGFCEGPWRYTKTNRIVSQDPSCQKVCTSYNSCPKWENGITTTTTTVFTGIVGGGSKSCVQLCNSFGCNNPQCSGSITQPITACQSDASSRVSALRNAVASGVDAEDNFDDAIAQSQRSTEAQNAAAATPFYVVEQYNVTVGPAPGGTIRRWNERWRCQESVRTPNPMTGVNEACGCNTLVDGTCEHDTGTPSTLFTDPGELSPAGPGISNQECLTYDDLPATTPADVQAKFEKLWSALTIAPTTVAPDDFQHAIVNRLKLMYELYGEQLQNQHVDTDQLHRAISLYGAHPDINPSCATVDAPMPSTNCTAPSVTTTRGDLIRCQRLADSHASEGVASISMTDCTALLDGYLDLKTLAADDEACGGPHLREVGANTVLQLEDKQLGLIASAPTSLGWLPRQLWLLDDWYTVSKRADNLGVFATPDQQRRDTSYLLGRFWDAVREKSGADAALAGLSESSTPDQAEEALGLSAVASRQSEQDVVNALFSVPGVIGPEDVTLTRPPLRGLPLLALLGDALKPLIDDLNGLAIYHDIACQFRDCRAPSTNTPSRNAWNILAALEEPGLGTTVSANPFALGGWNTVFGTMASQQPALTEAIADAVSAPGGLAAATAEEDVDPLARPLWLLYKHALAFHDHFETTGLFESTAENRLQGSLLEQSQLQVVNALRARANALDGTVTEYRNGLVAALQAQIAVMNADAHITDLTNQRLHKATEMNQKMATVEGLRASGEDEARAFGSLSASFVDVQAALDDGAFVQVGDTETFELDGQDGLYTGGNMSPGSVAAHTISGLTAGEMLVVQTSGSWTPTCAISTHSWLHDDGTAQAAALSGAVIGPEGYSLSVSASTVEATSAGLSGGLTASVGMSFKLCSGTGAAGEVFGVTAEACVHADETASISTTWSDSSGAESKTTAAFAPGLRLDDTPFPEAPVGSLLVVLMDPTTGVIRDVRVAQSGGTSILIEDASTAYFVVNDKQCGTAATVNKLSVSVRPVLSATAVADKALLAMADVLVLLRQQQETLAAQGTMLPTQATLIRQQAGQLLQARLGEIDATELPAPLASLFEAFVSHEIVATERRIEIAAVLRSLDLDLIELRTIDDELTAGANAARLQRLVPQWLLQDLDHDHLRSSLLDLLSVSRDYLKPILDLWYPHALDTVSFGPEINALLNADVGTSLVSLADSGQTFVNSLLDAYENATFGAKPSGTQLPVIVVSFPRPDAEPTNTFWREADAARAQRVWQAIDNHTTAHFEITPDDFYSANGGDGILSCNEVVPVIKTMAVYVVRPGADSSNQTLNTLGRTFQGYAGANQSFVTVDGPKLYQLADPNSGAVSVWQSFTMPVLYGESETARSTFLSAPRQTRPVGLSAAGEFDIDFSVLDTLPQAGALAPDDPAPATEIQLVFELDSRASSIWPTWVTTCN